MSRGPNYRDKKAHKTEIDARKKRIEKEEKERERERGKLFAVFNNWIDDSQILLFKSKDEAVAVFEKIVREQIDPDLEWEDVESRIADAVNDEYFEYSGDGAETIRPFVELQALEVK